MALGAALRAMLLPTRNEDGCLNYDLQGNGDPGLLFFHETRESADHHQAHLYTPEVCHLLEISPDMLLEPIRELKGRRIEACGRGRGDQAAFAARPQRPVGTLRSR